MQNLFKAKAEGAEVIHYGTFWCLYFSFENTQDIDLLFVSPTLKILL